MENYVSAQLQQLGASVALGAAGGLVYDVLRAARLLDRRDRRLTHLLDGLFVALLGAGALWLALVVGEGELRLYMVTGVLLGAVLWFFLLSALLRPVWDFWASALLETGRLLGRPIRFAARQAKKAALATKKGFSFCRKCATMKVEAWRSRRAKAPSAPQKGGKAMADKANRKKTKKRANPVLFLVIALLVTALGVQIIRVYGQLKTARSEEAVLSQQLQEQQQENDALRSDLAKKNDESFIKALARDLLGLAEEGERIFYDVND